MKKSITIYLILIILITSVTNVYADTDEGRLKKDREALSTYTDYPAVLEYFLKEDYAGGGFNNPKVKALVEDITKDCKTDYEKARAIFNWVSTSLPYDSNKENNVYNSLLEAYPMENEEIINDLDGIFEVISTKDTKILQDTILKYGNVHATANDTYNVNVNNQDELNTLVWKMMFSGKTEYANGEVYRPYGHKYIVEGNFSLQFSDEGSSISKERVIELPKNDIKENVNLILIFDKGFKLVKVFMVN